MITKKNISLLLAGVIMSTTVAISTIDEKIVSVDKLEMVKREITINHTDKADHSGDKFIIKSDKGDYEDGLSGSDVYFSVTNTGKAESATVNLKNDAVWMDDATAGDYWNLGRGRGNSLYSKNEVDELRVVNVNLSADWLATEYNNQNAPDTFATAGTPETLGGVAASTITGISTIQGITSITF